ncbi:hypothetical protein DM02DRAFT_733593 [Periconia macrospinosa]|uniref:Uncharacterized protein n=1 Tax=Periconia macrospinosa TaxID=97972 RepID=A0A2V1D3K3_9PLEO|nr:hypothetical protein DM02DRAFT_733593 [Periconia macrospinosa]
MNASASMRSAYVRQSLAVLHPVRKPLPNIPRTARPGDSDKLRDFKALDFVEYRETCNKEKHAPGPFYDLQKADGESIDNPQSSKIEGARVRKIFTTFPYRDPIYLVALVFLIGSIDLVINACIDLLPHTVPYPTHHHLEARELEEPMTVSGTAEIEMEEPLSVPITLLIGSILFFAAGIFDTFGALNADHGTFEVDEETCGVARFKPALLGTPQFKWIPDRAKFINLTTTDVAFQAGLIVLFGGVIFMYAGIVDFPNVVDDESPLFGFVVIGPQIIHGFLFFIANAILALSGQKKWWQPKPEDPDWVSAVLNTGGGFGFMVAGFLLLSKNEVAAAVSTLCGSLMFAIGSLVRFVTFEIRRDVNVTSFLLEGIANLFTLPLITNTASTLSLLLRNPAHINPATILFARLFGGVVIGGLSTALFVGATNTSTGIGSRKVTYLMLGVGEAVLIPILAAEAAKGSRADAAITVKTALSSIAMLIPVLLWRFYVVFVRPDLFLE